MTTKEESKANFDKLRMMMDGERVSITITKPNYLQCMVIYPETLTRGDRQELELYKTRLMDMATDAREEITNILKKDGN